MFRYIQLTCKRLELVKACIMVSVDILLWLEGSCIYQIYSIFIFLSIIEKSHVYLYAYLT